MKELIVKIRNKAIGFLYRKIFKPIAFLFEPETMHDGMSFFGRLLGSNFVTRAIVGGFFRYGNSMLEQKILGINFANPVGLAGGFDKDANLTKVLPEVGFGFMEVGSVTGEQCEGNPKPRLWRLKKSEGIVVYYGLKNEGAEKISQKLADKKFKIPVGINIAKTNCRQTAQSQLGIEDYVKAYKAFEKIGAFYVINISCPNAFGGEPFQSKESLEALLKAISVCRKSKPIFVKISPDLSERELDDIIEVCSHYHVDGFVCTNLTKKRDQLKILDRDLPEKGSISGKMISELSNKTISYIYRKTGGKYVIIGVGGIFSAEDAYEKIKLGASLVELITGMIFRGPQLISEINQELVELLRRDGFKNLSEAVGIAHKKSSAD